MSRSADAVRSRTPSSGRGWKDVLGRVGLVGRGVLYAVIGILALQLVFGDLDQEASSSGAIEWLASQPLGQFLLVALTVSLFALAAWRGLDAVVGDPVEGDETKDRVEYAGRALLYLALAITALTTTIRAWGGDAGSGTGGGGEQQGQQATATVLEWPGGRWIVAAVGVAVIAYAIRTVKRHVVDATFLERMRPDHPGWLEPAGRAGYAAKAVIFTAIGWFLVQAGISHEPGETKGLSGALQELAGASWGPAVLVAVAVGLLAFGALMVAEARYRRAA